MGYYPNAKSGDPLLDAVFSGALPLIRGPVEAVLSAEGESLETMGDLAYAIVQNDGDHLLTEGYPPELEPEVWAFLVQAINDKYNEWLEYAGLGSEINT